MNILSLYTNLYGALDVRWLPYWFLTPARRFVRKVANVHLPIWFKNRSTQHQQTEKGLIVSFTSFPARIANVWKVVESLKHQTILPEKIILWLSIEQFPDESNIPQSLLSLRDALFDIRFVEDNIRSHKKYYYILKEFPETTFITCDDDVFYDPNMIRRLVCTSRLFPGCIIANHTRRVVFGPTGEIMPYAKFIQGIKPYSSDDLIQIGIGGVLYPPHSLHEMVTNKDVFMCLTPSADDVWLNVMARLKRTPVVQSSCDMLSLPIEDDSPSLSEVNNGGNRNDKQIEQVRKYLIKNGYKDVFWGKYKCSQ